MKLFVANTNMRLLPVFALLGAFASPLSATGNHKDSTSVSAKEVALIPPVPTVSGFTYGGTGCPAGTVTSALTPVNSTLGTYTLTHTLPAMAPNGSVLAQSRKNCQFNVKIEVPKSWQYRINHDKFNVDGFVWLPDTQSKLNVKALYYWPNDGYVGTCYSPFLEIAYITARFPMPSSSSKGLIPAASPPGARIRIILARSVNAVEQ